MGVCWLVVPMCRGFGVGAVRVAAVEVLWERILGRLPMGFRSGWRGDDISHLLYIWNVKCGILLLSMILDSVSDFGYLDIHEVLLSLFLNHTDWV